MNGLTRNLPIKKPQARPAGESKPTVAHAGRVRRSEAGADRGQQDWEHWQGSGKGKEQVLTLSKTEDGVEWNGSRGRGGWIRKGKERMVAVGRRRQRKTGLWVVGEKPCRDVCGNDCRRPFVVSTLCSLERLWLQLQISLCGLRNVPHTQCKRIYTPYIRGFGQVSRCSSTLALFLER